MMKLNQFRYICMMISLIIFIYNNHWSFFSCVHCSGISFESIGFTILFFVVAVVDDVIHSTIRFVCQNVVSILHLSSSSSMIIVVVAVVVFNNLVDNLFLSSTHKHITTTKDEIHFQFVSVPFFWSFCRFFVSYLFTMISQLRREFLILSFVTNDEKKNRK